MTDEKVLDKLAKLKRHADSAAAIGSEAEAQAFAEMFQKLLLDHKLSMSDIDFETMEKESPVEKHFIDYKKYPEVKLRKTRVAWIERLASIVADAHFCRILVHPHSSRITLVGRREDTAVAEYLFVTLQRSIEKISGRAYDAYRNEERRKQVAAYGEAGKHGTMTHTFGFRESYIDAFINRLYSRLRDKQMERTNGADGSMALVRINRSSQAAVDFIAALGAKNASALSTSTRFHGEGVRRGRAAADAVNLDGRGIEKGGSGKKMLS